MSCIRQGPRQAYRVLQAICIPNCASLGLCLRARPRFLWGGKLLPISLNVNQAQCLQKGSWQLVLQCLWWLHLATTHILEVIAQHCGCKATRGSMHCPSAILCGLRVQGQCATSSQQAARDISQHLLIAAFGFSNCELHHQP